MNFFSELIFRLWGQTPAFFKTLQKISLIISGITALPTILTRFGITLPDMWNNVLFQIISVCGVVATVISQLTVTATAKENANIKD